MLIHVRILFVNLGGLDRQEQEMDSANRIGPRTRCKE